MSEDLKRQVEELTATVRLQGEVLRTQQQFMGKMMLEKLTKGVEVGEPQLLEGFADVVAPSVGLTGGINDGEGAADAERSEVQLFTKVYELAKDRKSGRLRKETARMLGSLMLKSDTNPEEIEFMSDDVQSIFSSKTYPRLLNEDDFFDKMEAAFMFFGPDENGLPHDVKARLLSLLDLSLLSASSIRRVERILKHNAWGPPVLAELRMREFVAPRREYKLAGPAAVVVTEVDLRSDVARSAIADRCAKEPDTKCILDVSGFLDDDGNLLADKLERLPSSVKHISFSNSSRCTSIGNNFLKQRDSLVDVDLTGLSNITAIGGSFLGRCSKLAAVDTRGLSKVITIGPRFLEYCPSLSNVDLTVLNNVTTIGDRFLEDCTSLSDMDLSCLNNVTTIGSRFLSGCSRLSTVDLDLNSVTMIGDLFLGRCAKLTNVDLTSLNNVTKIGGSFISRPGLSKVDVSVLGTNVLVRKQLKNDKHLKAIVVTASSSS